MTKQELDHIICVKDNFKREVNRFLDIVNTDPIYHEHSRFAMRVRIDFQTSVTVSRNENLEPVFGCDISDKKVDFYFCFNGHIYSAGASEWSGIYIMKDDEDITEDEFYEAKREFMICWRDPSYDKSYKEAA